MIETDKKIILFGYTNTSVEIGYHLQEKGYRFIIVDNNPKIVKKAKEHNFDIRILDYTDDEVLKKIGISKEVELIFALFLEDSKNIFLTISARALDPKLNIVSITQSHDSIHKLKIAGANTVIDPYQISAKKIYKTIKKPEIVTILDNTIFGRYDINIKEIKITQNSSLCGKYLHDVKLDERHDIIILGVYDAEIKEDFIFLAEGLLHKLDKNDILVTVGEDTDIEEFKKLYNL